MKIKLFFAVVVSILYTNYSIAQTSADSLYNNKIASLEAKISKIKNFPIEEQKQYFAILSDVENRKNILKSLLKTPLPKRDKTWEQSWEQNYSKASGKLDNIELK